MIFFLLMKKKWSLPREGDRMEAFRRTLDACQLVDIGFSRLWFTWERGRIMDRNIREILNSGVATDGWLQLFLTYSLRHLPHSLSNHCPLLIETNKGELNKGQARFWFEAWWVLEKSYEEMIRKLRNVSSGSFLNRMSILALGLKD